jgi:hypothetical protein
MQAYGVNSLILGEIEGANRAQAVVAEEGFASNVVNPLAEMMSQVMTQWVGPRFAAKREQLAVWIDPAVAHDIDVDLKIWDTALRYGAADRNEFRRIMMNLPEDPRFDGPMDPFSQMFLNSAAKPSMDMSEVGTREPDLIHSWKFDRVAQEAAKRNGDG